MDYHQHVAEVKNYLMKRGHNGEKVQQGIDKATRIPREELLTPQVYKENEQVSPLVVTFHPDLPHLTHILHDHQCVIDISLRLREALPKCPLVAYCRPPSLKELLSGRSWINKWETYKGNSPCKQPRCKACAHIKTGTVFNSTTTGAQFHVKATADCGMRNVVYLIEYKRCTIQYVGETKNALCIRLTSHRSDIKNRRIEKPVAKHFSPYQVTL